MSQTTPYLGNKRTPMTDPPSQPNLGMMSDQSPGAAPILNASRSVSDRFASSSKQLLNAYIYEFLVKNTLSETAKLFVLEADVPTVAYDLRNLSSKTSPILLSNDVLEKSSLASTPQTPALTVNKFLEEHNIPNLSLSMEAPQGFLYEWWQVFWDVHNVKNNKQLSAAAAQYHQMQLMKLRQQPEMLPQNMAIPNQIRSKKVVRPMKPNQPLHNQPQNQPQNQINQPMQNLRRNDLYMQNGNRNQQQAQTQMNNLRQQVPPPNSGQGPAAAAVAAVAAATSAAATPQNMNASPAMNGRARPMRSGPSPSMPKEMPYGQMHPQQQMLQQQMLQRGPQMPMMQQQQQQQQQQQMMNFQHNMPPGPHPMQMGMPPSPYGQNMAAPTPPINPPGRNMNALQDYQMQLMLLEKQNKKRLDIARFNVGGDSMQGQASPAPSPLPKQSPSMPSKAKRAPVTKRRKLSDNSITSEKKKKLPEPEKKRKKAESPKKAKTPTLKKEKLKKKEEQDEKVFYPMENRPDLLGSAPDGVFFTSGGNSSIDDIDFDFNSFLDGGDDAMSGGLSGFNWGNPVEGE